MMKKLLLCVVALTVLSGVAQGDVYPPKAKVNLNGNAYMGTISVNEDSEPDPNGTLNAPFYIIFGQELDRLWGMAVSIEIDDTGPGLPEIGLVQLPLVNGVVNRKKITISLVEEGDDGSPIAHTITGKVLANGSIKGTYNYLGKKIPLLFRRVNEDKPYSGFYLGKNWDTDDAPPVKNNFVVSFEVHGSKVTGSTLFYLPDEPEGVLLDDVEGTLNQETGDFTYQGQDYLSDLTVTGKIVNGKFEISADLGHDQYTVRSYHFGDVAWKAPNIAKKPKPKKFGPGQSVDVTIPHLNGVTGALLVIENEKLSTTPAKKQTVPDIFIEQYSISAKTLDVKLNVAPDVKGTFYLRLINPSGKSGGSKKFKVK
jgi:hypothetical protein